VASAAETYKSITIDADGLVTILTENGKRLTPPLAPGERGGQPAAVSPDRRSAAWTVLHPECEGCAATMPLSIAVLTDGKSRGFWSRTGSPISFWMFVDGGQRVAFHSETPHGAMGLTYELWDLATDQRLAEYVPTYDRNGRTIARPHEPAWVRALDAAESTHAVRKRPG
jgi:hypothetical protein